MGRAPPGSRPWRPAFRVLRAGLDRGLAGPGDVAGAAAGPGRRAGGRARADRGRVLRHRLQPGAGLGAAPAGRGPGRRAGRSGPRLGRGRDRRVRAGLLRRPVRLDGAAVRALRHPAMDPGSRRPSRLARRRSPGDDAGAGAAVQAGDRADPDPGPDRDGDPGASRAATWAAGRRTGTGWPTPGRTRTRSMRPGGGGRTGWNRTRRPLRSSAGCSPSGWPDTAPRGSPGP
jgi:hypothetical protein